MKKKPIIIEGTHVIQAGKIVKVAKDFRMVEAELAKLEIKAQDGEGEGEGEGAPKEFSMVAYTGGAMRLWGWPHPMVVDVRGIRVTAKARPILRDHDPARIVGHTTAVRKDGGRLLVEGVISGGNDEADEVVNSAANGFPWQASIGASADKVLFVEDGERVSVNGREFTGPIYVAKQSTLGEVSFVALGADDNTSAKVAAQAAQTTEMEIFDMNFEKWLEAMGLTLTDLTDEQRTKLEAKFNAEQAASDEPAGDPAPTSTPTPTTVEAKVDPADMKAAARDAAREAAAEIAAIEATAKDHPEIKAKALAEGWDKDRTELEVLRASRGQAPGIQVSNGNAVSGRVMEAALVMANGKIADDDILKGYGQETVEAADKRFGRTLGIQEAIVIAARANGYTGPGSLRSDISGYFKAAFGIQAAGFSTLSLPGIFSNVANKFLLDGFNAVEDTWRRIAAIRNVTDFKEITNYRLTGGFKYEKLGPDGEIKHATASEESYGNKADTYAKMFSITRHDIINDDLGALTDVPMKLGRGSALALNEVFWTEFLENAGLFFEAPKGNFITDPLGVTGLSAAEEKFWDQVDPDGDPLAVDPSILLVPNALNITASQLMRSAELREEPANAGDDVYLTKNPHAGKFSVARSAYLNNANIPGGSATHWWLLADPMVLAVIEVAFLNGRQTPIVETAEADFNVLGVQMRGYHDWGVRKQEHRAGVKSDGSA